MRLIPEFGESTASLPGRGWLIIHCKNNIGPQVRRRRYALGWSQQDFATRLQIAGLDVSRSGVSKFEARISRVDDRALLYLAEVLKVEVQDLFPHRAPGDRIHEFMKKLETTRF